MKEFFNYLPDKESRAQVVDAALASAPEWARKFVAEYRRRKLARQGVANLRPRDFGGSAVRLVEGRSYRPVEFADVRAADGSSLTKVPERVRRAVASFKWRTKTVPISFEQLEFERERKNIEAEMRDPRYRAYYRMIDRFADAARTRRQSDPHGIQRLIDLALS